MLTREADWRYTPWPRMPPCVHDWKRPLPHSQSCSQSEQQTCRTRVKCDSIRALGTQTVFQECGPWTSAAGFAVCHLQSKCCKILTSLRLARGAAHLARLPAGVESFGPAAPASAASAAAAPEGPPLPLDSPTTERFLTLRCALLGRLPPDWTSGGEGGAVSAQAAAAAA